MKVVIYARYSSESQRSESIDGQIRAIEEYTKRKGYEIVGTYIDRAKSATTDRRPEFLKMIEDSKSKKFDIVCVHKLDRFSRDKHDSVIYKRKLKQNGVRVESVTEQLDNSPESVILESVLEGMADYYSKNLARETMKGLKETALQCKHTGGTPALGYDVDRETRRYIINEKESKAVKLIYELYLEGKTIPKIVAELNERGFKTKKSQEFGLNSIRSILKNEKYAGVYVFNKSASKDATGRRNGNKVKDEKEIIKIDGGIPPIVTKEEYSNVQALMGVSRRSGQGRAKAKEVYLLSGLVKCSCGYSMYGNRRKKVSKPLYVSYRCGYKHKLNGESCDNSEIRKEYLESFVLSEIERYMTSNSRSLAATVTKHDRNLGRKLESKSEEIEKELEDLEVSISNIVDAIMGGFVQEEFKVRLAKLKKQKQLLILEKDKQERGMTKPKLSKEIIEARLEQLKTYVTTRNIPECKKIIKYFVNEVRVGREDIELELNLLSFVQRDGNLKEVIKIKRKDLYVRYSKSQHPTFLREGNYHKYSREVIQEIN